jgi:hypothetical protein
MTRAAPPRGIWRDGGARQFDIVIELDRFGIVLRHLDLVLSLLPNLLTFQCIGTAPKTLVSS